MAFTGHSMTTSAEVTRLFAPIRPVEGRWPQKLERRLSRFFWPHPEILLHDDADPYVFRRVMSAIHVGETIKITSANRHPGADSLLIDNVDLRHAAIVDIGASDGSTSVDLINRLNGFQSYVIADLYLSVRALHRYGHLFLFDHNDVCILVAGKRFLCWPTLSRVVRILYKPLLWAVSTDVRQDYREVSLLNPATRDLLRRDQRVSSRVHDVFTRWSGPPPDVIKVANLLRRLYFDDDTILLGLRTLCETLPQGGHLLLVDNPRIHGMGPRAGLYRREGSGLTRVAETADVPEISDLVARVSV